MVSLLLAGVAAPLLLRTPVRSLSNNLASVLILGPDAIAAAAPATPIQLMHACQRWGFSTVVPSSWGDELIARQVIRHCERRESAPFVQCSCPRVAERLSANAALLDRSAYWVAPPPVAVARYLRHAAGGQPIHVTYAGSCPGATDPDIDQRISAGELRSALASRDIDLLAQPTTFEDVIPIDRRRHFSSPAGVPDSLSLWNAAAFRVSHLRDGHLGAGVAQMLLDDERVLIDISDAAGCACRAAAAASGDAMTPALRSPTPILPDVMLDLERGAPTIVRDSRDVPPLTRPGRPSRTSAAIDASLIAQLVPEESEPGHGTRESWPQPVERPRDEGAQRIEQVIDPAGPDLPSAGRTQAPESSLPPVNGRPTPSGPRPAYRRQSTWRRPSPRPGTLVARNSGVLVAVEPVPFARRRQTRIVITTLLLATSLGLAAYIGRQSARVTVGTTAPAAPPSHARLP